MKQNPDLTVTIVIAVYNCENCLKELTERIRQSLKNITENYMVILVDDSSTDNSWAKIIELNEVDKRIDGIKLSRNFGQHHAITAGIDHTSSDWLIIMDCDLQDNPEYIPLLLEKAHEGYDIVQARRIAVAGNYFRRLYSIFFYKLFSFLTGTRYDGSVGNYGIYSKKVYTVLKQMREPMRAFPQMIKWTGFRATTIDVKHDERFSGKSSYTFVKLFSLGMNIIISFSNKPLNLTVRLGLIISFIAILFSLYNLFAYYTGIIQVVGYASIIISIWLLGGLIIFSIGILGIYIGKSFDALKGRPLYIIESTTGQTDGGV